MKFVYVLISGDDDYYAEECLVSILSLLRHESGAEIIVLTDQETNKRLVGIRAEIHKLATVNVYYFDSKTSQVQRSRFLKTTMRSKVSGDFVFIDTDTVIADSFSKQINEIEDYNIGMVLDDHCNIENNQHYKQLKYNSDRLGWVVAHNKKHFNSGVIFVKDTDVVHEFFRLWSKLYFESIKKNVNTDQTALNHANHIMNGVITEIDGKWNVQVSSGTNYISDAVVFHYLGYRPSFSLNQFKICLPFLICDKKVFDEIREKDQITHEIENIIRSPKSSFFHSIIIPDNCEAYQLILSNHFRLLRYLQIKHRKMFSFFEKMLGRMYFIKFRRV